MRTDSNKLTELQLELLKSFRHITNEKELNEIKSLLNFYFRNKLDESVTREENRRSYSAAVYAQWLRQSEK